MCASVYVCLWVDVRTWNDDNRSTLVDFPLIKSIPSPSHSLDPPIPTGDRRRQRARGLAGHRHLLPHHLRPPPRRPPGHCPIVGCFMALVLVFNLLLVFNQSGFQFVVGSPSFIRGVLLSFGVFHQ